MNLSILYLIASCDWCRAWGRWCLLNLEHLVVLLAGPISHTSIQYMDFVDIFNVSLNLSTIYFARLSGCWTSFVYSFYSCYSILECYNLFSGVKLSIRSFCFIPSTQGIIFISLMLDRAYVLVKHSEQYIVDTFYLFKDDQQKVHRVRAMERVLCQSVGWSKRYMTCQITHC